MQRRGERSDWRCTGGTRGTGLALQVPLRATPRLLTALLVLALGLAVLSRPSAANAAEPFCTDTWTGPAEGNWQAAGNWSSGQVPGSSDVACIGSGDTVSVTSGTSEAGLLEGEGALVVSDATLELANALESSRIASLTLRSATLVDGETLEVSSAFSGGGYGASTVSGAGKLVVGSGALAVVGERCSRLTLNGVTLVNQGTFTSGSSGGAQDGPIWMENGAQLQNSGTFNLDSSEPGGCGFGNQPSIYDSGGSTPAITNTGTFQTNDSQESPAVGVPFANEGTIDAQAGSLQLADGGTSTDGSFTAASGATVAFTGGSFVLNGATWSGAGTIAVQGAEVSASGVHSTTTQLSLSGGLLTVPEGATTTVSSGSLTISGATTAVDGSGRLVLGAGATGAFSTARCSRTVLDGVTLVNQGTITMGAGGGADDGPIWMENGAQLQNSGTFNLDSSEPGGCGFGALPSIYDSGGSTPAITNTGTFQSDDSQEPVSIGVPFADEGTIEAQAGTLQLSGGNVGTADDGSFKAASGATLGFSGGAFALSGASWSGAGTFALAGASLTATNLRSSSAHVNVSNGSLTIPEGSTSSFTALTLSEANLTLAGELEVSSAFSGGGYGASTVSGAGKLVVGSGALAVVGERCSRLTLNGVTLVNQGTFTSGSSGGAQDGPIWMENGAQLQNSGTFNLDSSEPGGCGFGNQPSIYDSGGSTPAITNTGTFQTNDSQESPAVGVPFANEGTIDAQAGSLQLADGGTSTDGSFTAASGATVAFTGGSFVLNGATWSGAGTIATAGASVTAAKLQVSGAQMSLSSGQLTIPEGSSTSVGSLALNGGTLDLPGRLNVAGSLSGSGQNTTIDGSGKLTLEAATQGTLGSERCARLTLNGVTLVNQGTLTLGTAGGAQNGPIAMENGAQLQNAGTFNLDSSEPGGCGFGGQPSIYDSGGSAPAITNTGTLQANDSQEPVSISVPFTNQGTIGAQAGTLQLTGGGASTNGSFTAASGATVAFTGGSYTLTSGSWSGAGTVAVQGANVTTSGVHATSAVSLSSGQLTVPQAAEVQLSNAVAIGGDFTIAGPGTVVAEPGASTTTPGDCSRLLLEDVTYINKGTFTLASGSAALWMQDGAHLQNNGTFLDQSEDPDCGYGSGGSSIYDGGGSESTIVDVGTFKAEGASDTLVVTVPFQDQGTVEAKSATLQIDGNLANNKLLYIAAGASLNVTGNYTEGEDGTLKLGVASPSSFGSLSVSGTSALDGLLEITSANGYSAEVGQSFAILSSAAESGAFSYVGGSGLASGLSYEPNYANTGVNVLVTNSEGQVPVPLLVSPPHVSSGSLQQGQTLVLSHGSWEHAPSEYIDQWLRCNGAGGECEPIAGAGGQEYVTTRSDVGYTIVAQEIARNAGGESKPADSSPTAVVTALPLRAAAGEPVSTYTGAKVTLDGSASTPSAEISNYRWEFGDGESAEGAVVRHVYRSPGTYTATLTISRGSEHTSQSLTVDVVTPPGAEHAAAIMLSDASEHPISEATVLYVGANGVRTEETTNSRGEADLAGLPEGEDTVYVYKSGFRPATGVVDVSSEHQGVASITLEPGEVATTGLSSHELTFSEIVEAGINPSEPANQTVDSFEAKLEFAGSISVEVELHGDINSEGEFAGGGAPEGTIKSTQEAAGGKPLTCEQQGATPEHTSCEATFKNTQGEETRIIAKPTTIETHPVIQWLILRGSAVTVKQFFEVSMVVQNLSPEEPFGLTAGTATLSLPAGMSLAPTSETQSLSQGMEAIPPLGSDTTHWIVRGDTPGSYTPSVNYQAELEPFGTTVSTQAALAQPLTVWGANALSTVLKIDSGPAEPGIPYHVTVGVKNVSSIPLYNVAVNTSAPVHNHFILQPEQQFTTTIGELRPGQTVFAPQYILITPSPHEIYGEIKEGKLVGESDAELQSVTLAGEGSNATPTIERVSPPTLYEAKITSAAGGEVHLQWQQVPGAEGYEIFSTSSLGTPFDEHPLAALPATADSAEVAGPSTDYYGVSALIGGRLVLDHPLVEASRASQEAKEKEEEEERKKEEEREKERERHEREEEAKKEKHLGPHNEAEPDRPQCESGDSVNCASGNHTETQTDLSVGGRGPALTVTRTYNSQQAVRQSKPGPFGYGWTAPYGAYITISRWCVATYSSCSESNPGSGDAVVHQANGSTVFFSKQEAKSKEGWVAGPLVQATLTEAGNNLLFRLPNGHTLSFATAGHLTSKLGPAKFFRWTEGTAPISSEADRNGNAFTFSYNEAGEMTAIADAAGRKISLSYNSEGQITSATDPMGHVVKYGYEKGDLVSVTEPGESSPNWRFAYNSSGEMTSESEGANPAATTEYDSSHRVITQTDAMGRKRAWKYTTTGAGPETIITEPNGSTTVEQFNDEGSPTSVTRAYGTSLATTSLSEYNGQEELVSSTDSGGGTTTYTYDAEGNRTSETDPLGNTNKWTYNGEHEVVSETTPGGETTTITRDAHGNETEVSRPAPGGQTQATKYGYDADGDMTSKTDALGNKWTYTYDQYGDRESETDPEGEERTYTYDADSNLITTVSPLGNVAGAKPASFTTTTERDAQERPIKTTNPLKATTKTTYTPDGQVATSTEADGNTTTYTYDADNEQTKVTEADGATKETEYDAAGQVIGQINGDHHKTTYVRNALEQVTEVIDPLGRKTIKTYEANGNLASVTNPEGQVTAYGYDADNNLTKVTYSDGKTAPVEYQYDVDGSRTKMFDGSGTTTYVHDQLDRLTEILDGHGERSVYAYDLDDHQTKITYPNGQAITRTFDADGRLKSTTDWLGNTTTFTYNADSDQTATVFPHASDDEDTYTYNDADELTKTLMKLGKKTLASLTYTRAKNGGVTKSTSKGLPGEAKTSYTYDKSNRVTDGGATAYEYDAADNPTKIGSTTNTFNAASELTGTSAGAVYAYNEEGERTKASPSSGPTTTYKYNQAGELTAINRPGEGATAPIEDTYTYDGGGLRVAEAISGTTHYLTWDTSEELPLLLSDGSNSYIYGPGNLPLEQVSSGGIVTYLHHDQQGSTRLLTGSTGATVGTCSYSAYGVPDCEGTAKTPLGYDGQYTNAETGLQYLRARSYEPATGQFLSVDPVIESTGVPFSFADDDPLNASDPLGLESTLETQLQTQSNANEVQTDIGIWEERLRQLHQEQSEAERCGNKALASQKAGEEHSVVATLLGEIELLKETLARLSELERKEISGELLKLLAGHGYCTVVGLGGGAVGGALGTVGGPPGEFIGASGGELGTDLLCDQIAQAVSP